VVAGYAAFPWLPYLLGNQPRPTIAGLVGLAAWLPMLVTAAEVTRMRRERALQARRNQ
jgi:hypothetical protein